MNKIDKLIQRIDKEIGRNKDKLKQYSYISNTREDIPVREHLKKNIEYLNMFRVMAIEVKEKEDE